MKKRLIIALLTLTIAFTCGIAVTAVADEPVLTWTTAQSEITVSNDSKGVATVTSKADFAAKLTYSQAVNFNNGAYMRFLIPKATDIDLSDAARTDGKNYIKVTALNSDNKGVEFKIYSLYSANASNFPNKMEVDVTYLDPSIVKTETSGNLIADGKEYLESFSTYLNVVDTFHYIDIHKENGMWFFAFDNLTAMPVAKLNELDLSSATVTLEYFTKSATPTFKINPFTSGVRKNFIENDFMQFGSDEITPLADDTVKYKIKDKRSEQYPGQEVRYREQLISSVGYDVRNPINIEYSYDVSNASAVWYALGLGRPDVLSSISKLQYNVFNYGEGGVGKILGSYSDSIASKNDGIMLQTTTGLAQPTEKSQNSRKAPYITNSASKPYAGRENIDVVTFIVKENGTDMYMNGDLIFDNLITKLSDFESSGYMAYPYFHFFEDNASSVKGNTIVIKGVNAPIRTDEADLKVVGGSNADVTLQIDSFNNGNLTLWENTSETATPVFEEVDSSLYSYNNQTEIFTIKYGYFTGKEYGVYNLYARNDSGSEEITVRFSDPALATIPPTTDKETYYWKVGAGTQDLVVTVDIKNGIWSSFSGGGITQSQYVYAPGADKSIGTITISKDYLNGKKAGSFTFTIKTTDEEENSFTCKFTVVINETGVAPGEGGGDDGGGNGGGNPPPSEKVGCGSAVSGGSLVLITLVLGGTALIIFKRKKSLR